MGTGARHEIRRRKDWGQEHFTRAIRSSAIAVLLSYIIRTSTDISLLKAMNEKIHEAAGLLRRASDMLLTMDSENSNSNSRPPSAPSGRSVPTQSRPLLHSVAESVIRARNMMERSRDGGTFRRLGLNERLRSVSQVPRAPKGKPKRAVQTKGVKEKPFEFALLSCKEDDVEHDICNFLKKDMIVERGIVTLGEQDSEVQIREKIVSSLKEKYSIIGPNDFEFVKVTQKKKSVSCILAKGQSIVTM